MSKKFDVFSKQLQETILSMKDLKEENKISKEQNNDLRNKFNLLFKKINNEECKLTVKKIATALNVEVNVVNTSRIQSKFNKRTNKIVAELTMKQCKRVLIETARKTKLTGIKNLFFKTKSFARDSGYKFVWFKDAKIFIKKDDNSKAVFAENDSALTKLI
ncbi:hypothetical protein QTP88_019775 [Uroleucon formosanum]